MKRMNPTHRWAPTGLMLLALLFMAAVPAQAQVQPPQRQIRTYVPPDQLVSFLPSTPFSQFTDFLNPIFERVTGRQIVDPETRTNPIGIAIAGMHFLDAFELVLEYNGLAYRETDRFFIVEPAVTPDLVLDADAATGRVAGVAAQDLVASLGSREVQINAILFELNHTKARDLGIDWNVFFGETTGGGTGGSGNTRFQLRTDRIFENLDDILIAPDVIDFTQLTQFFRLLETNGVGKTVANPSVTVQSGEEGRIQIGSDVPVQTRDFAGNTVTQFFSTGIIVEVVPTLVTEALVDTLGAEELGFIHLDVQVERSSSRPSLSGPVIDRNTANTQVLLLDGEQTVIGGLYSTEESVTRRGIPVLKDLPGWVFGLRYIFGYEQKTVAQRELLIVLQAKLLDTLEARSRRSYDRELLEKRRQEVKDNVRRVDEGLGREVEFVDPARPN